jgi:hypothetical protein
MESAQESEEPSENDERNRNTDQPQEQTTTHFEPPTVVAGERSGRRFVPAGMLPCIAETL